MNFSEKYKRLYVVGMPASGKSTFAQQLAFLLEYDFLDLDTVMVAQEGMAIADIFAQKGETYFRELERQVLESQLPEQTVIATGGGAPCFFQNMDFILEHGFSVFLDVPLEELARRSAAQNGLRPLLNNLAGKALLESLQQKRNSRIAFYERADLVLQGDSIDPELVAGLFSDLRQFFL